MVKSLSEPLERAFANLKQESEKIMRVLHVDDDLVLLKTAKSCLEMQGQFEIDAASSVEDALKKIGESEYDAIISDYQMPSIDGLEFLKELRDQGNKIPFIIFTGKGREEVAIKALNLGADQYLDKHGDPETVYTELAHNIREAVEKRNMTQMLVESEEKYRNLVEDTKDSIVIIDLKGNVQFANKATEELTGYTEKSHPANLRKVTPIKYWPKSLAMLLRARKGESTPYFESVIRRKDGTLVPVESGGKPLFRNGKVVGIQIITRDISTRKKEEREVLESERKYRELADQLPEIVFETDTRGRLTFLNERAYEITGYTSEDFAKGLIYFEFMAPHDLDRAKMDLKRLLSGEKIGPNEYLLKRKNGSTFPVQIRSDVVVRENEVVGCRGIIVDVSERARMEQARERFSSAVKMSSEGVVVTDLNGRIIEANDAATRFYRANAKGDLVGKNVLELVDPQERHLALERLKEATEKGFIRSHEYCVNTPSGSTLSIELTTTAMRDKEGIAYGFVYIIRDVTARKKREEDLRASEEKYHALVGQSLLGVAVAQGTPPHLVYANPAMIRLSGYTLEELASVPLEKLVYPDDRDRFFTRLNERFEGKDAVSPAEYRMMPKDGKVMWVELFSSFVDYNGKPAVQAAFIDITERKKIENKLKESEEKYRLVSENMPCIVFSLSADDPLRVQFVSGRVEEVSGYPPQKFFDNPRFWTGIIHGADREYIEKKIAEHRKNKTPFSEEYRIITRDGRVKWVKDVETHAFDEGGKVTSFVGITLDITDMKNKESEIALMNEKLRIVGGLTRHDVRNKLSVIVGNTYLARKARGGKDEILHHLQGIDEAVQQITAMLDFAKTYEIIGSERLTYFDLEKALKEATSAFPHLKTVKVISDCHGLSVRADSLFVELFRNLVDNSLKYGEKLTKIRVYCEEDSDQLMLMYEDDGVGISHEDKLRIFSEGFTTGKGSGHGLYLIRKLTEIYGWTIQETGETGKGARFVITIPKTNSSGKENYRRV